MSKTFCQSSSVNLIEILSIVIPALLTSISNPPSCVLTSSIKSLILLCSSNLNLIVRMLGNFFFFRLIIFFSLVPVAAIFASKL